VKRRARRCLGIDIGSTSLKVAELSLERAGVAVHRLVEAPLDLPPDAPAEDRWTAIAQTLRDLLRSAKISCRQAAFALPGHAVFVRRVRLPRTHEERLQRIIRFEARQQIPFPLEQTLLQYQITPTETDEEVEVLLVAIKRDLVEHYMAMIRRLGLHPIHLGVSSFALYNFHMFNQGIEAKDFDLEAAPVMTALPAEEEEAPASPDGSKAKKAAKGGGFFGGLLGGKKKAKAAAAATESDSSVAVAEPPAESEFAPETAMEEVKAYLHIGASTMDLAIGRTGGSHVIGFSRSIPLAGNQMTRAIQTEMGADSFADAERIKRERARVLIPGEPVAPDSERPSRAIMPVVDRMIAEIRRSLDFYISQPDGMAVDRMVISGGQAALPNLSSCIEERLGIPIEMITEVQNSAVRWNTKPQSDLTGYLVAIGLALQGLGAAVIDVDFLPEHIKGWIEFKNKNMWLLAQAGVLGAMIFLSTMLGERMTALWSNETSFMKERMLENQPLTQMYLTGIGEFIELEKQIDAIQSTVGMPPEKGATRDLIIMVINLLQTVRPSDVTFQEIRIGPLGDLVVKARSKQQQSASNMGLALQKLPEIQSARLSQPPPAGPASGASTLVFEITAKLRDKVSKVEPPPLPAGQLPGMMLRPTPGAAPGGGQPAPGGRSQYDS
jgi:Tfp pilus assembly PilM family ATPase